MIDDKTLAALTTGGATLLGAVIGGVVALVTNHMTLTRDLAKERLLRAHDIALNQLGPKLYEPLLAQLRESEWQFQSGQPMRWPRDKMLATLKAQSLLRLVAPQSVQDALRQLEFHMNHNSISAADSEQLIWTDLKLLEAVLASTLAQYRLEEPSNGK